MFNLWISREFRLFQLVYTVRNIPNRICKTASKVEKEILKIGRGIVHVLSNMQNVVLWQRQRNEQRIITHAYTAIVLVAVAVEQPNKHKRNENPAEREDGWECRKHLFYETKSKHKMAFRPPFRLRSVSRKSLRLSTHRASSIIGRTGTMSKNNLRGITFVRRPIWGFALLPW